MRLRLVPILAALSAATACALLPATEPEDDSRPEDIEGFARLLRESLQEHEWQSLLVSSDPALYEAQVVRGRTPEPLYLARLLGLDEPGNNIQEGDSLEWRDLERITLVTLAPVGEEGPPFRYTGLATLESGVELRLEAWVTRVRGRYVLAEEPSGSP